MTEKFTKEDYQKALDELIDNGETACVFEIGGSDIIRSALQSQLTKNDENVTCGNLSNADGRQAALESIDRLDGWLSELKGMIEAPQELLLINRPSILADINCAIKDMRVNGACIRAALQSPRVPVIEGLDEAMSVINKFIRARDAEIDFLPEKSTKNTSEWISHFVHNVNYSLSFNDWMNLDKVRAYAELQKGN